MTIKKTIKARNFTFIIYPESIPDDWIDKLESLGVSIAISPLHNMDEKESKLEDLTLDEQAIVLAGGKVFKKAHYHVLYIAKSPVTVESVRNKIKRNLGKEALSHIEIVDNVANIYKYLTHESADAIRKNKYRYDKEDIVLLNDFDIDRYIYLDESQKRELKNKLLRIIRLNHLVNVSHMFDFLESNEEYSEMNENDINDVVTANPGGFRLYFDANYQAGYRQPIINSSKKASIDLEGFIDDYE